MQPCLVCYSGSVKSFDGFDRIVVHGALRLASHFPRTKVLESQAPVFYLAPVPLHFHVKPLCRAKPHEFMFKLGVARQELRSDDRTSRGVMPHCDFSTSPHPGRAQKLDPQQMGRYQPHVPPFLVRRQSPNCVAKCCPIDLSRVKRRDSSARGLSGPPECPAETRLFISRQAEIQSSDPWSSPAGHTPTAPLAERGRQAQLAKFSA